MHRACVLLLLMLKPSPVPSQSLQPPPPPPPTLLQALAANDADGCQHLPLVQQYLRQTSGLPEQLQQLQEHKASVEQNKQQLQQRFAAVQTSDEWHSLVVYQQQLHAYEVELWEKGNQLLAMKKYVQDLTTYQDTHLSTCSVVRIDPAGTPPPQPLQMQPPPPTPNHATGALPPVEDQHHQLEGERKMMIKGELCGSKLVEVVANNCFDDPDDAEGDVCLNDGQIDEAYCAKAVGPFACARCKEELAEQDADDAELAKPTTIEYLDSHKMSAAFHKYGMPVPPEVSVLEIKGGADRLELPPLLSNVMAFTIVLWIKVFDASQVPTDTAMTTANPSKIIGQDGVMQLFVARGGSKMQPVFKFWCEAMGDLEKAVTLETPLRAKLGRWAKIHIAADGTMLRLFLDDALEIEQPLKVLEFGESPEPLTIGSKEAGVVHFQVTDVGIWKRRISFFDRHTVTRITPARWYHGIFHKLIAWVNFKMPKDKPASRFIGVEFGEAAQPHIQGQMFGNAAVVTMASSDPHAPHQFSV